jgi:hypothetical protein
MDARQYCTDNRVVLTIVEDYGIVEDNGWEHHEYEVNLKNPVTGVTITSPWGHGLAISNFEAEDVLDAAMRDADVAGGTFDEFCDNLGYDNDSIRALRIFERCQEIRSDVIKLVGGQSAYDTLTQDWEWL